MSPRGVGGYGLPVERGFSRAYAEAQQSGGSQRATPADAFRLARETYLAGHRLDMRDLASRLGVSRNTLYRWCGQREELLGEVIWSVTEEIVHRLERETEHLRGRERLRTAITAFVAESGRNEPLLAFFENEGFTALRVMTASRDGRSHQDRLVAELARLIAAEDERSRLRLAAVPEVVAYTLCHVIASSVYNVAVAAVEVRMDMAQAALDYLLAPRAE